MKLKNVNPKKFKQFVALQQRTRESDGQGGGDRTWATIASMWVQINPRSANQRLFGDRLEHNISHIMVCRFRSDVDMTIDLRVVWETRCLQVHGIIDIEERKCYWEVMLEEGKPT